MSTSSSDHRHLPILAETHGSTPSVFDVLAPKAGDTVLDCTLGLGGHARRFAELIGPEGTIIGLDADEANLQDAKRSLDGVACKTQFIHTNFQALPSLHLPQVDILFADIGVSSPHFDDADRGFSFRSNGPLDMRFDRTQGRTAAELISESSFDELRQIFRNFGELKESGYLARFLHDRTHGENPEPVETTQELVACIEKVCGWRAPEALPRVFQALRIAVNDELGALQSLLEHGPGLLKAGGRMGIIAFHSLEDRLVKQKFRELTAAEIDEVTGQDAVPAPFVMLTKKAIVPSGDEIRANQRARSAKFRAIAKR